MIPLDWKDRLQRDTDDFLLRKLSAGAYDIDIIYNAYPERIEGKVPKEVITFVSKAIASHVAKKPRDYVAFLDYLWARKGENGKMAATYILARLVRKDAVFFLGKVRDYLQTAHTQQEANLLLDKTVLPLLKNEPDTYLDVVVKWLKTSGSLPKKSIVKQLVKLCQFDADMLAHVFKRMETQWLYADEELIKINVEFMKSVGKLDPDFYASIYDKYANTRNPEFVEILSGAVVLYAPPMEKAFNNWAQSGNARLKRAALAGQKLLLRKKKEA